MHRIYANRINSRSMSRVFCDLRSQKTPRGILPVNSNHNFLFFRKNHKNCLHSNNQYAIIRPVIRNSSQTKCPDSSVGRAEDWKSSCRWFDSGSGHFFISFFIVFLLSYLVFGGIIFLLLSWNFVSISHHIIWFPILIHNLLEQLTHKERNQTHEWLKIRD